MADANKYGLRIKVNEEGGHNPVQEWFDEFDAGRIKLEALLKTAKIVGGGVPKKRFMQPFERQNGDTCQTLALIVGLAILNPRVRKLFGEYEARKQIVDELRREAAKNAPGSVVENTAALEVDAMVAQLQESTDLPVSRESATDYTPTELMKRLFAKNPKSFLLVENVGQGGAIGHVYALVPVEEPEGNLLACKIDTLYGEENPTLPDGSVSLECIGLQSFFDLLRPCYDGLAPRKMHLISLDEEKMPTLLRLRRERQNN